MSAIAITAATNFSGSYAFSRATDDADAFDRAHVNTLALAVDDHDHRSGRGLGVLRVQTGTVPANAGEIRVNGENLDWYGTAVQTAVRLADAQTITGNKTFNDDTLRSTGQRVTTSIDDSNGNEMLRFTATASAVNDFTFTNAVTGGRSAFAASGDDANVGLDIDAKGSGTIRFGNTSTGSILFQRNVFLNDDANTNMSLGLTLNQGANTDQIIALKASDVAHGVTSRLETDTWCQIRKYAATGGGVWLEGIGEATNTVSMYLNAIAGTDTTTKLTSSVARILLEVMGISGANVASPGADANLIAFRTNGTTRFIFDQEGSAHADVEWVTFDKEDDLVALRDLEAVMLPQQFGQSLRYRRHDFERLRILGRDSWHEENGRARAMVNWTRLAMLHHGAMQQLWQRFERLDAALGAALNRLAVIEHHLPNVAL